MKCLEKDRTLRYETASALARDVERYLADEPVEACPPSTAYKLKKFAQAQKSDDYGSCVRVHACSCYRCGHLGRGPRLPG